MMTVAACVLATEPAAIVAQNLGRAVDASSILGSVATGNEAGGGETGNSSVESNPDQHPQIGEPLATTVQLPTFAVTRVSTTVNVPDGGTVLLGGIKRMSEGRAERGVPMLSKIPYISRLFRNVTVGRDTNSLMLMVTPRIIIQEE